MCICNSTDLNNCLAMVCDVTFTSCCVYEYVYSSMREKTMRSLFNNGFAKIKKMGFQTLNERVSQ